MLCAAFLGAAPLIGVGIDVLQQFPLKRFLAEGGLRGVAALLRVGGHVARSWAASANEPWLRSLDGQLSVKFPSSAGSRRRRGGGIGGLHIGAPSMPSMPAVWQIDGQGTIAIRKLHDLCWLAIGMHGLTYRSDTLTHL